jgi:hypothetical protein
MGLRIVNREEGLMNDDGVQAGGDFGPSSDPEPTKEKESGKKAKER